MDRFPPDPSLPRYPPHAPLDHIVPPPAPPPVGPPPKDHDPRDSFNFAFLKGPKRKRLAKACDACHKSKRRCDGTAPCSNCYFASKDCTYTDAAGRAVPAPRAAKPEKLAAAASHEPRRRAPSGSSAKPSHSPVPASANSSPANPPSTSRLSVDADDFHDSRKRPRRGSVADTYRAPEMQPQRAAALSTFPTSRLDLPVVRELVNLFFAHCHPQRLFIHQPTFLAALAHSGVPTYLQYAMCANAAPLSKQAVVRTKPPRIAGNAYATQAISEMFDKNGRLLVERNLAAVQALCLLQSHELVTSWPWPSSTKYFDLALSILEGDLHLHQQNNPVLTPVPSPSFVFEAIERECARRAFWYIRLLYLTLFSYYSVPVPPKPLNLSLRLPVDETSFEFGAHSALSEYLHVPAPRTPYTSEFGHLVRVASIHAHLESTLRAADSGALERGAVDAVVLDSERALTAWDGSLADHVRFGEESAALQIALFETGANAGAWCFFMMHVVHAACILALCDAKYKLSGVSAPDCRQWARGRLLLLASSLGARAKNSMLLVAVLLTLRRHALGAEHPQVAAWEREHEDTWGMKLPGVPPPPAPATDDADADDSDGEGDGEGDGDGEEEGSTYGRALGRLRIAEQLPSLKACGLLDAWAAPASASAAVEAVNGNGNGMSPAQELPPPPWKTLLAQSEALKASSPTGAAAPAPAPARAGGNSAMPVGLHWLENER
ncbi:hypothetical protein FA95DRAFT_1676299 [Auriscalpium vulgare]|uniref:Uncharacterized protein n=1 Tax=Auriscalpium vulgare TaxID=40419 RepID=A0ACB8S3S5_9AGAM|nr:hypothetical protein FA95DRAFT_1676299 [Auriscalpium vulgare]